MEHELINSLAARKGHFRLESGHHGDLWLDLDHIFVRPAALRPFAAELGKRLAIHQFDAVCGPLTGGAWVAQMIATELETEFFYAERLLPPKDDTLYSVDYRIPTSIRRAVSGKRIALVDDAINAGSAVRATLTDLEACGALPVAIGALLLLGSRGTEFASSMNIPLEALVHLPGQTWEQSECPMCLAGIPLDDLT